MHVVSCDSGAGVLTESRGSGGDAVYSRVEQLVEAGVGRGAARDVAGLAPENEPPLTSAQDLIRQVCCCQLPIQASSLCDVDCTYCQHVQSFRYTAALDFFDRLLDIA